MRSYQTLGLLYLHIKYVCFKYPQGFPRHHYVNLCVLIIDNKAIQKGIYCARQIRYTYVHLICTNCLILGVQGFRELNKVTVICVKPKQGVGLMGKHDIDLN